MLMTTRFALFAYAALLIVGGVIGYTSKGSVMSLAAGVVCGLLALVGGYLLMSNSRLGLSLGLASAVLVAGSLLPRFLKNPVVWPSGITVGASILMILLTATALFTSRPR